MPTILHEALTQMFRHRPALAAELLSGPFGLGLPDFQQARLDSCDLNDLTPTEYRADAVVALTAADALALAVVVEVQLGRDDDKRWSWPVYLTTLRARLRCPAVLLVVCADKTTARWCARSIELGHPGWALRPLVLGPGLLPVVTDIEQARSAPELAVLSALVHGRARRDREKVLRALPAALAAVDREDSTLYADLLTMALPAAARRYLEVRMTSGYREYGSEFVSRFVNQGRAEGEAKGKAEGEAKGEAKGKADALLQVLGIRGIAVPEDARARITGCSDVDQLRAWLDRAMTVASIEELFE